MRNTVGVPASGHIPVQVGDRTGYAHTIVGVWHDEPGPTTLVVGADSIDGRGVCGHIARLGNGACVRCHPPPT